jgi:ABC-type multidrug transport system ATPase subunit
MRGALVARSLTKSFGDAVVLGGVSLTVGPGDRVGIVGPNGIGKSTLLRVRAGLEPPDGGSVRCEP